MRLRFACLVLAWGVGAGSALGQERIILHPKSGDPASVELFISEPEGPGPWPVMLFVHGHQSSPRPGGRVFIKLDRRPAVATVDEGRLQRMQRRGYLAAALSLPGYGATLGPPDFFGPRSQRAVLVALDHLLAQPEADHDRVVVYGVSGGAATISMAATSDARITALILVAGLYDLGDFYPTGDARLDAYIEHEAGTTPESFAARAALRRADRISAMTLILHGADDTRGGAVSQARRLGERLQAYGVPTTVRIYDGTGHSIPMATQWEAIDRFLAKVAGR